MFSMLKVIIFAKCLSVRFFDIFAEITELLAFFPKADLT